LTKADYVVTLLREFIITAYQNRFKVSENTMKVLALNSSPRSNGQSKTEQMMLQLVKGMTEAGASVEVINLREKRIRNCTGCFTCWTRTPGVCVLKDDMTQNFSQNG